MANIASVIVVGASSDLTSVFELFAGRQSFHNETIVISLNLAKGGEDSSLEIIKGLTHPKASIANPDEDLQSGRIYIVPPGMSASFSSPSRLELSLFEDSDDYLNVIDRLFASAAETFGRNAIGIILSGAGKDGGQGLRVIGDAGGLTLVQEPSDANQDSMPSYALTVEVADLVVPVSEMAAEIAEFREFTRDGGVAARAQVEAHLEPICEVLRKKTSHDFRHYKSSTLIRRIQRRMQVLRVPSVGKYLETLAAEPAEVDLLFKELLINVTSFFRDTGALNTLRENVIQSLIENVPQHEKIRVWVAGCSTGEEAYSLAMLFLEALDELKVTREIQIIATDIDEHALSVARKGVYPTTVSNLVSEPRLERFFQRKTANLRYGRKCGNSASSRRITSSTIRRFPRSI